MEIGQGKLVPLVLAGLLLGAVASTAVQDGTASGSITVNDVRTELRYAYVSTQPGFFDKKTEDIRILLASTELAPETRSDTVALTRLARDRKLVAVEVIVNASGQPMTGAIFVPAFNGMVSLAGMHLFEATQLERTRIAGRLYVDGPRTFDEITYHYDATFSAPIPRPPTAAELAAALASPPAKAATAYLAALRTAQLKALLATLTTSAAEEFTGPEGDVRFKALRSETPSNSKVVGLQQPTPTSAIATIQGTRDGIVIESTLELVLEAGAWKVAKW